MDQHPDYGGPVLCLHSAAADLRIKDENGSLYAVVFLPSPFSVPSCISEILCFLVFNVLTKCFLKSAPCVLPERFRCTVAHGVSFETIMVSGFWVALISINQLVWTLFN